MKILVTGHLGFIGHHVVDLLVKHGHKVIGVDRVQGISEKSERIDLQKGWPVTHVEADLGEFDQVANVIRVNQPDAIAHIAAQYSVKYTTESCMRYVRSNLMAPTYLFEAAKCFNVPRVVYASSVAVSDGRQPSGLYGATKGYNEEMAHAYTHRSGIIAVGLRYGPTYGPLSRKDAPVYMALRQYLDNLRIKNCQIFARAMPYVFVKDAARVTVEMLLTNKLPCKNNVFLVGADESPASIVDIVRCAQIITGKIPRWPPGVVLPKRTVTLPDYSEMKKVIGYAPNTKLTEGVADMLRWMSNA